MDIKMYCIKCGYTDASIKYTAKYSDAVFKTSLLEECVVEPARILSECLKLTCNRCSYTWEDDVLKLEINKEVGSYILRED